MLFNVNPTKLRSALHHGEPGILDGKRVSNALLDEVGQAVRLLSTKGIQPSLAVVQVGEDPASSVYVRHKVRACERVGIHSVHHALSATSQPHKLWELLNKLNQDADIHGILVQLPVPEQWRTNDVIAHIDPRKDVDGFHPLNLGCLASSRAILEPCTPVGIMTLLDAAQVSCLGKQAVVVGRSIIVGRPMAQMLVRADATVTVCHRFTSNLEEQIARADIVIVATGVPELIKGDWIKPGAVVIDVGITRLENGKLVGDVEFNTAHRHASWITPVPGGVGPMTVATLLENTIRATCLQNQVCIRGDEIVAMSGDLPQLKQIDGLTLTYI